MVRRVLTWLVAGASAALLLLTLAGLGAPLDPRLEMINHFRPLLLAASISVFALALILRKRALLAAAGGPLIILAGLMLAPLYFAAPAADGDKPNLRVVSLNLWVNNERLAQTALFLRIANADVIVLQEVLCERSDALFDALRAEYPHQFRASERCFGQAILSKYPILTTGRQSYKHRDPIWIWAELEIGTQIVRVTSVHLSHPTQPSDQVVNIEELARYARGVTSAHVMAGDFNLTPYSWLLNKFAWQSGMMRGATYAASWPGHRALPAFLIDHIFTSADIARTRFHVGPFAGSDHLPVIADLILPRRALAGIAMPINATSNPHRF